MGKCCKGGGKKKGIVGLAVLMLVLSGCGHNIGTAFTGKVLNVGYDPELNKFGLQYYDGALVTGLQKEHATTEYSYKDEFDVGGKRTGSEMKYKFVTGDQVTGYAVDLEEVKQGK